MIMAEESICPENNRKRAKPEMTAKTGAPNKRKSRKRMKRRRKIIFPLLEWELYSSS
jgi:hypothetical protein